MKRLTFQLVAVVGMVLSAGVAQSEMPSWWPGSGSQESASTEVSSAPTTVAPVASVPTATVPAAEPMVDSPLFNIGWPKVEMPKFSWKLPFGDKDPNVAPKAPSENPVSGALDSVASASKKAANKVRNVWGSAISKLTPGGDSPAGTQVAKDEGPGFWSRMFGPDPEPQGSQTVTQFLAQERPGKTYK